MRSYSSHSQTKMSFNTVRNHIASLLQILTTNEIAIETRPVVIRNLVLPNHGGQQGTRVTWANPTGQGIPPDLFTNTVGSGQIARKDGGKS